MVSDHEYSDSDGNGQYQSKYVKPFWQVAPVLLSYPFKSVSLLTIGLYTFLFWVAGYLLFPLGNMITVITMVASYQFCYSVLSHTANGHLQPPENFYHMHNWGIFWQQFALWFSIALIVVTVKYYAGWFAASLVAITLLIPLPMATMILAIDQTLMSATNIFTLIEGIKRIGKAYLLMLVFLAVMIFGFWLMQQLVLFVLSGSPTLASILVNFSWLYGLVSMFFLMGYVIYQFHDVLGYELECGTIERNERIEQGDSDPAILRAEQLLAQGQPEMARTMMREAIHRQGLDSSLNATFKELCLSTGAPEQWYGHSALRVIKLFEAGKVKAALDLAEICYLEYPEFKMVDGDVILGLSQAATERGRHQLAIKFCQGFGQMFPGHKDMVALHILVARILFEHLGNDKQARKIVIYLLEKHAKHPLIREVHELDGLMRQVTD